MNASNLQLMNMDMLTDLRSSDVEWDRTIAHGVVALDYKPYAESNKECQRVENADALFIFVVVVGHVCM